MAAYLAKDQHYSHERVPQHIACDSQLPGPAVQNMIMDGLLP